jgi:hypothetical protein
MPPGCRRHGRSQDQPADKLTTPTSDQRRAFDLISALIPLTLAWTPKKPIPETKPQLNGITATARPQLRTNPDESQG